MLVLSKQEQHFFLFLPLERRYNFADAMIFHQDDVE
jgi:hypothetical protein